MCYERFNHILSKTVGVGSIWQDVEFDFTISSLVAAEVVRVKAEREYVEWAESADIKLGRARTFFNVTPIVFFW